MKAPAIALISAASASCLVAGIADSGQITEITVERTACYGTCPVYKVTLRSDGTVSYEGKEFVKAKGRRSGRISPVDFQQLARQVQHIGFFDMKDEYVSKQNPNGSRSRVTDLPTTLTTVQQGKNRKTVKDYYGGPEALRELEDLIDRVSRSETWVKGQHDKTGTWKN